VKDIWISYEVDLEGMITEPDGDVSILRIRDLSLHIIL
jgi:hypothetical protein